ncbi:MAG TPA: hypothetical protein VLT87_00775 [Thermoanaerobaculia bacterium]|nr:hypothetical protein [Thermoanaerobaculia bacterium]
MIRNDDDVRRLRPRRVGDLVVEPAVPEDEPELRRLLRDNPMDGEIRVSLEREPNAFLAAAVEGEPHHTIVAREIAGGGIVGMGSRSVGNAFVNGEPRRLGYLSQLRVDHAFRGQKRLLTAGYDLIRSFRAPGEAPFDVTSIIADNEVARRLLSAGLAGLPTYREIEPFTTLILPSGRARRTGEDVRVERGSHERMTEVAACLERNRCRYQLAPRFTVEDLLSPERSRGLAPEDFYLAMAAGEVVGCLSLWDQGGFKQVVVRGYGRRLARFRPWINRLSPLLGTPRLPDPGQILPHSWLAHVAVDGDEPGIFRALVDAAHRDASARGDAYVVIGLAARHPWVEWLRKRFRAREYRSVLYAVHWEDGKEAVEALDGRMPHLEAALL